MGLLLIHPEQGPGNHIIIAFPGKEMIVTSRHVYHGERGWSGPIYLPRERCQPHMMRARRQTRWWLPGASKKAISLEVPRGVIRSDLAIPYGLDCEVLGDPKYERPLTSTKPTYGASTLLWRATITRVPHIANNDLIWTDGNPKEQVLARM